MIAWTLLRLPQGGHTLVQTVIHRNVNGNSGILSLHDVLSSAWKIRPLVLTLSRFDPKSALRRIWRVGTKSDSGGLGKRVFLDKIKIYWLFWAFLWHLKRPTKTLILIPSIILVRRLQWCFNCCRFLNNIIRSSLCINGHRFLND